MASKHGLVRVPRLLLMLSLVVVVVRAGEGQLHQYSMLGCDGGITIKTYDVDECGEIPFIGKALYWTWDSVRSVCVIHSYDMLSQCMADSGSGKAAQRTIDMKPHECFESKEAGVPLGDFFYCEPPKTPAWVWGVAIFGGVLGLCVLYGIAAAVIAHRRRRAREARDSYHPIPADNVSAVASVPAASVIS